MKKNKIINLFDPKNSIPKNDIKYSGLLQSFIEPFENDFPEDYDLDDIFEFSKHAWNFGNMSTIVPKKEFEKLLITNHFDQDLLILLKKMIRRKATEFKQYDLFVDDFEIEELGNKVNLIVTMITPESYLEKMKDEMESEFNEDNFDGEDFDEGYIDRFAIIIKPKQAFIDWINKFENENPISEHKEANIYLIADDIFDLEQWLMKKYSYFFELELVEWNPNKKEWPQKRNYKMFKEWFNVDISTMIYDLERYPIHKNE